MTSEERGEAFVKRFLASDADERQRLRPEGEQLADAIRRASIDLQMSKATEFSPRIVPLNLLAAKVALLVHGPDAERLEPFERSIRYYASYDRSRPMAEEYERFRADVASCR